MSAQPSGLAGNGDCRSTSALLRLVEFPFSQLDQLRASDSKATRYPEEQRERWLPLASLQFAEERSVDARLQGKRILRDARFSAQRSHD